MYRSTQVHLCTFSNRTKHVNIIFSGNICVLVVKELDL